MTDSIYNNAGMPSEQKGSQMSDVPDWAKQFMPLDAAEKAAEIRQENELKQLAEKFSKLADMSEQGAAPEIPSPTVIYANLSNQSDIERFTGQKVEQGAVLQLGPYVAKCDYDLAIKRIAALTLERDALKAERDVVGKGVEILAEAIVDIGIEAGITDGMLPLDEPQLLFIASHSKAQVAALKAKVERLTWQPITSDNFPKVGDEAWRTHNCGLRLREPDLRRIWREEKSGEVWLQMGYTYFRPINPPTPPAHPINDDEQRRKDAAWNDRPKARCICGEMIAWYSGEYLHVAGRSGLCADGRLASPAHFLVGMPPAEPEWQKEKP